MRFRPTQNRIVVKQTDEVLERTAGGIVLTGSAKEKPLQGKVVAVGEGVMLDNGTLKVPEVEVGNTVVFGKSSGTAIEVDGEKLLVMTDAEIFGVLD